jgi:FtsP/CotA-like multicopper oxidase with cupredoxin domain
LLRFANLGYQIQSIQLLGMRMLVIGEDATFLRGPTGANLTYETSTIYIGPGEAKDVIIHAPTHSGTGDYNTYWLRNRNAQRLKNGTEPGMGGQVTQVQVYPSGALGPQTHPNQTYPENSSPAPYLDPWII